MNEVRINNPSTANELMSLRTFKTNALHLLLELHPILKSFDYIAAKRAYDFVVANQEKGG